jgi:hypothetical protein
MDQRSSSSTGTYSATELPFTTKALGKQTIQTFETLSLKSTQQSNDNIMLHYEDTSGKTNSVTNFTNN